MPDHDHTGTSGERRLVPNEEIKRLIEESRQAEGIFSKRLFSILIGVFSLCGLLAIFGKTFEYLVRGDATFWEVFTAISAVATALAFAAIVVNLFQTRRDLSLQRKALLIQIDEARDAREQFEKQAKALEEQAETLKEQHGVLRRQLEVDCEIVLDGIEAKVPTPYKQMLSVRVKLRNPNPTPLWLDAVYILLESRRSIAEIKRSPKQRILREVHFLARPTTSEEYAYAARQIEHGQLRVYEQDATVSIGEHLIDVVVRGQSGQTWSLDESDKEHLAHLGFLRDRASPNTVEGRVRYSQETGDLEGGIHESPPFGT